MSGHLEWRVCQIVRFVTPVMGSGRAENAAASKSRSPQSRVERQGQDSNSDRPGPPLGFPVHDHPSSR